MSQVQLKQYKRVRMLSFQYSNECIKGDMTIKLIESKYLKDKNKKTEIFGILRIPNSTRASMFHKSKRGKGSYDRKKGKSIPDEK